MYNFGNSGYVGQSRSKRSDEAIENGEVPISMIKLSFLEEHFQNDEIDVIINFGVSNFKKLAIQLGANSWHHTGKYYNETDHYNVYDVYAHLVKMTTEEKIQFKEENKEVKKGIKKELGIKVLKKDFEPVNKKTKEKIR